MRIVGLAEKEIAAGMRSGKADAFAPAIALLSQLVESLAAIRQRDEDFVFSAIPFVVDAFNDVTLPTLPEPEVALVANTKKQSGDEAKKGSGDDEVRLLTKEEREKLMADEEKAANERDAKACADVDNSIENLNRYAFVLHRYAGQEATIWFGYVVACLLSSKSEYDIRKVNPFLGKDKVQTITMLHVDFTFIRSRVTFAQFFDPGFFFALRRCVCACTWWSRSCSSPRALAWPTARSPTPRNSSHVSLLPTKTPPQTRTCCSEHAIVD